MKYLLTTMVMLVSLSFCLAGCRKSEQPTPAQNNGINDEHTGTPTSNIMKLTVGAVIFTATLNDNATAIAFKALLPLTINMSELNGNEKFFYLSATLPTQATPGGNIQAGDLMLYGNNCLVLFYESFNTSYSYTRIGKVDNISGLITALGSGSVSVKFELE